MLSRYFIFLESFFSLLMITYLRRFGRFCFANLKNSHAFKSQFKAVCKTGFNLLMHHVQDGQAHFKNLAAFAVRF